MRSVKEILENIDTTDELSELFGASGAELCEFYNNLVDDWRSAVEGGGSEVKVAANLLTEVLELEVYSPKQLLTMVFMARWLRSSGKQEIMKGLSMIFD